MGFVMKKWEIQKTGIIPRLNSPIMVVGLPGIGNVGKVAIDFMIDEMDAKKIYEVSSYSFPHSVFVNEENLVELPKVELYYKSFGGKRQDILFLAGDVQPIDEASAYEFSDMMLEMLHDLKGKEVITLGGIGLGEIPKSPKVYCTGNSKKILAKYKTNLALNNLHGVVGPIIGVSGLMLGLAEKRHIESIAFLAETFGHPMYLGINGAREILKIFNEKFAFKLDLKRLDQEIKDIEQEMGAKGEAAAKMLQRINPGKMKAKGGEASYIG